MDVMTASIPVSAYRAEPMTAEEIDAHPDAGRIWATIKSLRADMDVAIAEADERVETARDEGYDDGADDKWRKLSRRADDFKRDMRKFHAAYPEWLDDAIDGLVEDCL